ncbi:MAG: lycopene cyclase domain-containing protein [Candidatus Omnitrophica bacterium]|nr:lycopene cyclase domain-containing protein [Candidatus Omnitrophota bacterium]
MSRYGFVLLLSFSLPFALSFYSPLKFYRNIRALFLSIFITVFIFGIWDVFATWRGHWWFDPKGVWGLKIINLPLEEWLFFVVIPFCCLFTWEAMKYISNRIK